MKKKLLTGLISLSIFLMPLNVFAYSDEIIVGGDNIGIHIDSKGILIIGFYKVNGDYINASKELQLGDIIQKVNNTEVNSIKDLTSAIEKNIKNNEIELTIKRNDETLNSTLKLIEVEGIYKTGLYVKDGISGIGTLTYIDPGTKIFGTLGHEILESNTKERIEVKSGQIFDSKVSKIIKSNNGKVGEKNAELDYNNVFGKVEKNTLYGVFGEYTSEIPAGRLFKVAKPDEIKVGSAHIYTVLSSNEIKEYEIQITKINKNAEIKNLTFEITDESLLKETGGIVQGMSGSPIIQDGKIIGAVTHAIVDDVKNGYGIFITTMLEEGEK